MSSLSTTEEKKIVRQRILVVDDTEELNLLLCMMINKNKETIAMGVSGGREALEVLQEEEVDLVLLDMMMPEMSGLETLVEIRKNFHMLPVVMCTAKSGESDIRESFRLGADDYLVKPVQKEALGQTIRKVLAVYETLNHPEKIEKLREDKVESVLSQIARKGEGDQKKKLMS